MAPAVHDSDDLRAHLALVQEHPQHFVSEKPLQLLHGEPGGNPEQALAVESAVGGQYVEMGMKAFRKVAEGVRGHERPGFGLGHRGLDEGLYGLPPAPAQVGQEPSVPEEEAADDLGNGEHEVAVGYGRENMGQDPLAEGHGPFLMAGRAQVAAFTGKGQDPFRTARVATNPGEALVGVATGQVADHDLLQVRAPEAVALLEPLGPELFQCLVVILHAVVQGRQVGLSGPVDRAGFGHGVVLNKRGERGPCSTADA